MDITLTDELLVQVRRKIASENGAKGGRALQMARTEEQKKAHSKWMYERKMAKKAEKEAPRSDVAA